MSDLKEKIATARKETDTILTRLTDSEWLVTEDRIHKERAASDACADALEARLKLFEYAFTDRACDAAVMLDVGLTPDHVRTSAKLTLAHIEARLAAADRLAEAMRRISNAKASIQTDVTESVIFVNDAPLLAAQALAAYKEAGK